MGKLCQIFLSNESEMVLSNSGGLFVQNLRQLAILQAAEPRSNVEQPKVA